MKYILMYVDNIVREDLYLLNYTYLFSPKSWALWRNKNGNVHYWKCQKLIATKMLVNLL